MAHPRRDGAPPELAEIVGLPPFQPDDPLGREVFSERRAKKAAQGTIPIDLFELAKDKNKLSVDRLGLVSDEIVAAIADRHGSNDGRPFFGWAQVSVGHASDMSRKVVSTPKPENPYHADIVIVDLPEGDERREVARQHAVNLAKNAAWRPRPPGSVAGP